MNTLKENIFDVVIVGGGASGTSLLYTLSRYTNIKKIALVEKYDKPGQVNSRASNNSQTLHVGDIETNYSLEKVRQVKPAAMMLVAYVQTLPDSERSKILFKVPKMVLGVGKEEVALLEKRHKDLLPVFPELKKVYREEIATLEPAVVCGRDSKESIVALYNEHGYAVDFENLAQSFVDQATLYNKDIQTHFNFSVEKIEKTSQGYCLKTKEGQALQARVVIVDADSYSLLFAKQLGYGLNYSLIPIAGTFYFSKKVLNGKVYTVQEPKLPFAAVHGDPDVCVPNQTRFGPTARFHPFLESFNSKTMYDYFKSSGLNRFSTWISFFKILLDPIRFIYLLKNMLYELPWFGKQLFISNVKKIIPTLTASDIRVAEGYGGMRLQRVDTTTHELQLGEGKIIGDNIIFNMTPSPGASVALYNALRDAEHVVGFLGEEALFEKDKMQKDFMEIKEIDTKIPVSIPAGYAS